MANIKYLLPCSCGQKIPIEIAQAGQEVRCTCGACLEVPTLQGIRRLAPVPIDAPQRRKSRWGLRQRLIVVGAVITLIGLLLMSHFYRGLPRLLPLDRISLASSWIFWEELREGPRYESPEMARYHAYLANQWRWIGVAGAVAVLGLMVMASSLLIPQKQARKPLSPKEVGAASKVQGFPSGKA